VLQCVAVRGVGDVTHFDSLIVIHILGTQSHCGHSFTLLALFHIVSTSSRHHCTTLHHTAPHCTTLQHTATHCSTHTQLTATSPTTTQGGYTLQYTPKCSIHIHFKFTPESLCKRTAKHHEPIKGKNLRYTYFFFLRYSTYTNAPPGKKIV